MIDYLKKNKQKEEEINKYKNELNEYQNELDIVSNAN